MCHCNDVCTVTGEGRGDEQEEGGGVRKQTGTRCKGRREKLTVQERKILKTDGTGAENIEN